jgi:gas vesicle protein
MSDRAEDFFKGLIIGGVIGAVVGILYAPKRGKETQEDIIKKAEELTAKTKAGYESALEKGKKVYETAAQLLKHPEPSQKEKI